MDQNQDSRKRELSSSEFFLFAGILLLVLVGIITAVFVFPLSNGGPKLPTFTVENLPIVVHHHNASFDQVFYMTIGVEVEESDYWNLDEGSVYTVSYLGFLVGKGGIMPTSVGKGKTLVAAPGSTDAASPVVRYMLTEDLGIDGDFKVVMNVTGRCNVEFAPRVIRVQCVVKRDAGPSGHCFSGYSID